MLQARMREVISPFYMQAMGTNALVHGGDIRDAMVEMAAGVVPDEVCSLLRSAWREQVMGAWYSMMVPDETNTVLPAVLTALERSHGSFTAPPLATAALTLGWNDAAPPMRHYIERDLVNDWGAVGFVGAALELLDVKSTAWVVSDTDRMRVRDMLAFGHTLRPS